MPIEDEPLPSQVQTKYNRKFDKYAIEVSTNYRNNVASLLISIAYSYKVLIRKEIVKSFQGSQSLNKSS